MQYLNRNQFDLGADCQQDAQLPVEVLQRKAEHISRRISGSDSTDRELLASLQHQLAEVQLELGQGATAWDTAYPAFVFHLEQESWQQAVEVCDTLFRCEQPRSLTALGHGLWLAITFPVEPSLTVSQLQHVIDETPEDSDGAAVAAAVAAYVVELRGSGNSSDDATLAVGQMMNDVARRHGNVQNHAQFDRWIEKMQLGDPSRFLVRMRNIIDVLVQDDWWIDRDALQDRIPMDN